MPCIHSSMLYATAGVWLVFFFPQGHPGPLAFVLFSTTASAMAWQPPCTVLTVIFISACLPAQITGPAPLDATSLAFSWGSPSLRDHLPNNKIASPGARTMALVFLFSRPSWNMSAINKPVHAWGDGG